VSLAQEYAKMIKNACLEYLVDVFICHVYVYIYVCMLCYVMSCHVMSCHVMLCMYVCMYGNVM